jgi:hypothetical protein
VALKSSVVHSLPTRLYSSTVLQPASRPVSKIVSTPRRMRPGLDAVFFIVWLFSLQRLSLEKSPATLVLQKSDNVLSFFSSKIRVSASSRFFREPLHGIETGHAKMLEMTGVGCRHRQGLTSCCRTLESIPQTDGVTARPG